MITKSHDITEDRMMDAVCMAVDAYGFENLTTKQWAEKANVSEGSLYYHFENKDGEWSWEQQDDDTVSAN